MADVGGLGIISRANKYVQRSQLLSMFLYSPLLYLVWNSRLAPEMTIDVNAIARRIACFATTMIEYFL
jgi:hypothetical protein